MAEDAPLGDDPVLSAQNHCLTLPRLSSTVRSNMIETIYWAASNSCTLQVAIVFCITGKTGKHFPELKLTPGKLTNDDVRA